MSVRFTKNLRKNLGKTYENLTQSYVALVDEVQVISA